MPDSDYYIRKLEVSDTVLMSVNTAILLCDNVTNRPAKHAVFLCLLFGNCCECFLKVYHGQISGNKKGLGKKPKSLIYLWYRGPESNRHDVTITGF